MSNFRSHHYENWSRRVFPGFCDTDISATEIASRIVTDNECDKHYNFPEPDYGWFTWDRLDKVMDCDFYTEYEEAVSEKAVKLIEREALLCGKVIKELHYIDTWSPKDYTYRTDRLIICALVDYNELYSFIKRREEHFEKWLKNHFTMRDGYIPPIPNNFKELRRDPDMWDFLLEYFFQYALGVFDDPDSPDFEGTDHEAFWYSYIETWEYELSEYSQDLFIKMVLEKEKNNELVSCC